MVSRQVLAVLLAAAASVDALALQAARAMPLAAPRAATPVMQFGGKQLTVEEKLEKKGYWPGEWVCADCGYIYEPDARKPFEELKPLWKCPQCAGPRRRFVKKAGGVVGELNDTPLLVGTAVAGLVVIIFVYVGLTA